MKLNSLLLEINCITKKKHGLKNNRSGSLYEHRELQIPVLELNLNANYKNKSIIIKSNRQQYYIDLQTRRMVKTIIYTKSHIYSDIHIYTAGAVSIYTLPDRSRTRHLYFFTFMDQLCNGQSPQFTSRDR